MIRPRFYNERTFATKVGSEQQSNTTTVDIYWSLCWNDRPTSGARRSFGPTDGHGCIVAKCESYERCRPAVVSLILLTALSSTMTKRHNGGNSVSLRERFAEAANGSQHILIQAAYVHNVAKMSFYVSGSSMSSNTRISMIGTTCAAMMLFSMMSGVGAFSLLLFCPRGRHMYPHPLRLTNLHRHRHRHRP